MSDNAVIFDIIVHLGDWFITMKKMKVWIRKIVAATSDNLLLVPGESR